MCVSAEDGIDASHARSQLKIDVHAVMREQHDYRSTFTTHLIDGFLHLRFLDAETPVGREVTGIGNWRVGKRLADDCDQHTVHFFHHVRREYRVAEIGGLYVLRDEFDPAFEIVLDNFLDALIAQCELPMAGHHVDAKFKRGIDHVLPLGPQGRRRALPGIATVEQQRARTPGLQLLHQRGQMRKATNLAVFARRFVEIEIRERMRVATAGRDAEMLQQFFADQMRRLTH